MATLSTEANTCLARRWMAVAVSAPPSSALNARTNPAVSYRVTANAESRLWCSSTVMLVSSGVS
jgi:hypothetical protein